MSTPPHPAGSTPPDGSHGSDGQERKDTPDGTATPRPLSDANSAETTHPEKSAAPEGPADAVSGAADRAGVEAPAPDAAAPAGQRSATPDPLPVPVGAEPEAAAAQPAPAPAQPATPAPAPAPRRGLSRRRWWAALAGVLLVIALIVGGALGIAHAQRFHLTALPTPPAPVATTGPALTPADAMAQAGVDPQARPDIGAALAKAAADPALGRLSGQVSDLGTGTVLWEQGGGDARIPASATKILTAVAAWQVLPHDARQRTWVERGAPGELVLRSDGDVTLTVEAGEGLYTAPASLRQLAEEAAAALGPAETAGIRRIVVDNAARQGDTFNPTWSRSDIGGGNVTELDAILLHGGRLEPQRSDSPRTPTPGRDAGATFARLLGVPEAEVTVATIGAAAEPQQPLALVRSAPLDMRLRDMLVHSDNMLAEDIGHQVARARNLPPTYDSATRATVEVLADHGLPTAGLILRDNSGMSEDNRISAAQLDAALTLPEARAILDMLPVAGGEGTLRSRYAADSGAQAAAGWVRAKTGTLSGVNALVGTVMTVDGRPLAFAFLSDGQDIPAARAALDRLADALRSTRG